MSEAPERKRSKSKSKEDKKKGKKASPLRVLEERLLAKEKELECRTGEMDELAKQLEQERASFKKQLAESEEDHFEKLEAQKERYEEIEEKHDKLKKLQKTFTSTREELEKEIESLRERLEEDEEREKEDKERFEELEKKLTRKLKALKQSSNSSRSGSKRKKTKQSSEEEASPAVDSKNNNKQSSGDATTATVVPPAAVPTIVVDQSLAKETDLVADLQKREAESRAALSKLQYDYDNLQDKCRGLAEALSDLEKLGEEEDRERKALQESTQLKIRTRTDEAVKRLNEEHAKEIESLRQEHKQTTDRYEAEIKSLQEQQQQQHPQSTASVHSPELSASTDTGLVTSAADENDLEDNQDTSSDGDFGSEETERESGQLVGDNPVPTQSTQNITLTLRARLAEAERQIAALQEALTATPSVPEAISTRLLSFSERCELLEAKIDFETEGWEHREKEIQLQVADLRQTNDILARELRAYKEREAASSKSYQPNAGNATKLESAEILRLHRELQVCRAQIEELQNWKGLHEAETMRVTKRLNEEQLAKDQANRQNKRLEREVERIQRNLDDEEGAVADLQRENTLYKNELGRIKTEYEGQLVNLQVEIRRLQIKAREV
eukprot:TRINITY_DN2992_c0_g2_i4.p1 TRINITY_DN2992_c0_g2~~TRINITY_DN2992_c0_g2_i4.p1  ORF type:complete len:615 (+),score=202.31 TRINITY_DN2992_c0_g2_i4:1074-2918(+)